MHRARQKMTPGSQLDFPSCSVSSSTHVSTFAHDAKLLLSLCCPTDVRASVLRGVSCVCSFSCSCVVEVAFALRRLVAAKWNIP